MIKDNKTWTNRILSLSMMVFFLLIKIETFANDEFVSTAVVPGLAVVDNSVICDAPINGGESFKSFENIEFFSPTNHLVVPAGKTLVVRMRYDFPIEYSAPLWSEASQWNETFNEGPDEDNVYCNPSESYSGKGVAYGWIGIDHNMEDRTLEAIEVITAGQLVQLGVLDNNRLCTVPVDVLFRAQEGEISFDGLVDGSGGEVFGWMYPLPFNYGVSYKLPKNEFIKSGGTFQGWATSFEKAQQGIVDFTDEEQITIVPDIFDSDMVLYAVWAPTQPLTLEAESADWSHGSITLRCTDADTSGATHSYSLFYEDENGCTNAVEEIGAANVTVGADGFAHLTDSGFSSRLGGIPPVKYFVKDENGRWSAECVTRNRYLLSVGFDSYRLWWQKGLRQALIDAAELKRLCERNGEFDTKFLRNSEATTNGIRNAMTDFAGRTQPGDLFVFYIATHGGDYSTSKQARLAAYDTYYPVSALQADVRKFDSGVAVACIVMACHSASMTGGVDDFSERVNQWLVACGFAQCLGNVAWIASCESTQSSYNTANFTMFGQSFIDDGFGGGYADGKLYGVDFRGEAYEGGNSDGLVTLGELGRYAGAFAKGVSDKKASNVKLENDLLLDRIVLGRRTGSTSLSRPGMPTNPTATQGDTRIDIDWTASGNATIYRIYRYPLDAPGEWEWIGISGGTRFRDETTTLTREYGYRIRAVNPVGVSDLSDVAVGSRGTSKILKFLGSFLDTASASADEYDTMEKAIAPNGFTYGASYVAGLVPNDPASKFKTTISMDSDGKPVVSWSPDLNESGTKNERVYRVFGAKELGAATQWDDVTDLADPDAEGYRFFKVAVEMP